jgi:hypothetical protein
MYLHGNVQAFFREIMLELYYYHNGYSAYKGNIPLQKDLEVTPSITTNVEAPLEVTAQEEPRPRTSK